MQRASEYLVAGDTLRAADAARDAFGAARAQRSHQLLSDAWTFLLDVLAADPDALLSSGYREAVEGAFAWGETMPEEIQVWFFPAIEPHLDRLAYRRLVHRSRVRTSSAAKWLERGNVNASARLQRLHLDDLQNDRIIDLKAVAMERTAAFYADELFDPEGTLLRQAARLWQQAGREDRAAVINKIADDLAGRGR